MDLSETNPLNLNRHPWEISRTDSVIFLTRGIMAKNPQCVDIGAGDLYFASRLVPHTTKQIYACDAQFQEAPHAPQIKCLQHLEDIPDHTADVMFLLDVLEHIDNESPFLQSALTKLKPDGHLIITVPAFSFLFSEHDRFLKHYRRYNKKNLLRLLKDYPLSINHHFYFYSFLFICRAIQKMMAVVSHKQVATKTVSQWPYPQDHLLTKGIRWLLNINFRLDYLLSKIGINPWGLSLCVMAQKKSV